MVVVSCHPVSISAIISLALELIVDGECMRRERLPLEEEVFDTIDEWRPIRREKVGLDRALWSGPAVFWLQSANKHPIPTTFRTRSLQTLGECRGTDVEIRSGGSLTPR